ncbi:MAG: tetratricopeptide repeat protein [Thermodesulfovibrionales bacterium]|nr:tetratricopeptide repeat protein [Thermodesulfovibrionales bacterium]
MAEEPRQITSEADNLIGDDKVKALLLKALRSETSKHEAYNNLGLTYVNEDIYKAERCFKKAIQIKSDYAEAIYNLANVYKNKRLFKEAINLYNRALRYDPHLYQAYYNIANIFLEFSKYDDAIKYYFKAIKLNPQYYQAYSNLGVAFFFLGEIYKSIEYYKKSIRINYDFAEAHFNLGLALLMLGDFKTGWSEYKWRWKLPNFKKIETDKPEWDGSDINGKRLLIYAEQGYGDTIQFVRYLIILQSLKAKVKFACPDALVSLIQHSFPDVEVFSLRDNNIGDYDFHCPLLDLPRHFTKEIKDIPSEIPYLKPSKNAIEKFKLLLPKDNKPKIGLIWQGSRDNRRGFYRSIDIRFIELITKLEGINFVSLMIDNTEGQQNIIDLSSELIDFEHTAGLIENLDLIITIDTAAAHLAGALGKPVWLMLHYISDWRWMLERDDSPWYPSMKIFRQRQLDDWRSVIEEITEELTKWTGYSYEIDLKKENDIAHAEVNWDKALALLKDGDLKNGWRLYEYRRWIRQAYGQYPDFGLIEWKGQDLKDKGILIYDEQGFGDSIQFVRFIEYVFKKGARVYLLCKKELFRLLQTFNDHIQVLQRGIDFTVLVDYICPLMSLPLNLGIANTEQLSINTPYLEVKDQDIKRWNAYIHNDSSYKIGIAFSSKKGQSYEKKNSVPIELILTLLDLKGIRLFNVQKGATITNQIEDYSNYFSDFYDTASFIMNLDLVISIDTASAHLSGALGKETWLMLPYDSEWRWFNDTDKTIWYPTMRIFKQTKPGDWLEVLERVKKALRQRLNGR